MQKSVFTVYALIRPKLNFEGHMTFDLAYLQDLKPDMWYNIASQFLNCTIWQNILANVFEFVRAINAFPFKVQHF